MRLEPTVSWLAALAKNGVRNHTIVMHLGQREYAEWLLEAKDGKLATPFQDCIWIYGPDNISIKVLPK